MNDKSIEKFMISALFNEPVPVISSAPNPHLTAGLQNIEEERAKRLRTILKYRNIDNKDELKNINNNLLPIINRHMNIAQTQISNMDDFTYKHKCVITQYHLNQVGNLALDYVTKLNTCNSFKKLLKNKKRDLYNEIFNNNQEIDQLDNYIVECRETSDKVIEDAETSAYNDPHYDYKKTITDLGKAFNFQMFGFVKKFIINKKVVGRD